MKHPQRQQHQRHHHDIRNHPHDPPRSLTQVLLPHLSKPSLCVVSGVLLVLVHGMNLHQDDGTSSHDNALVANANHSTSSSTNQDGYQHLHHHQPPQLSHLTTLLLLLPQSSTYTTKLLYPLLLLLLCALCLLFLQYTRLSKIISSTSPIPGLRAVPNAHPYMGHYSHLLHLQKQHFLFRQHATPSGISAMWGPGLKRCASVLLADHARLILRHNSQRDFSDWIIRHGRKTLGEDSLILIAGGQHWKNVRKVVAKAFTNKIVRDGRKVVGECARECVDWLWNACEGASEKKTDSDGEDKCGGHGVNNEGKGTACLEAEDFFKMFSLNVFGRVAMGYDFQCINGRHQAHHTCNSPQLRQHGRPSSPNCCTCLTMPPEAKAFEFLSADIGLRAAPKSFINPAMQCYWIPTKHNRTYKKNIELVNELMGKIIGRQLDRKLEDITIDNLDESQREDRDPMEENMVTRLLESCMEQHFSQSSSKSCPFASRSSTPRTSSSFTSSSSSDSSSSSNSSIPPPSQITNADKQKIIRDVTKILHTLLGAGYETTAISLSYVMYCLSKNPRVQERCCEEARRVTKQRKGGGSASQQQDQQSQQQEEEIIDDEQLPYCRAVLTESIRMHMPILFTTRVLSKDLTLDTGYSKDDSTSASTSCTLLKGTRVIINPEIIHLDERNFERAEEFIPERWVRWDDTEGRWVERDYDKENDRKDGPRESPSPTTTIPPSFSSKYTTQHAHADTISPANPANFFSFSDGARNCVGRRLAIMESTILIAVLFRDMCVGLPEEDFELVKERRFVTVKPVNLPIVFWKR